MDGEGATVSCDASIMHGMLSGVFYGALWGVASSHSFFAAHQRKLLDIPKPPKLEALKSFGMCVLALVLLLEHTDTFIYNMFSRNVGTGVIGFTYFLTAFRSVECVLSSIIEDRSLKPIVQGTSSFCAAVAPLYWDSRCIKSSW